MIPAILLNAMFWAHVTLAAVTLALLWRWVSRKRYTLPPGPKALPLLGNNLERNGLTARQTVDQWRAKYGPVFLFYLGPKPTVYIASIEAFNEAYVTRGADFSNKPSLTSLDIISNGGKDLAFAPYDKVLVSHRKLTMQALRLYLTGNQLAERANEAVVMALSSLPCDLSPVDPRPFLTHIVLNILHGICFGYVLQRDDQCFIDLIELFESQNEVFMGIREDKFPFLRRVCPSQQFKQLVANMDFVYGYLSQQWRKNKEHFDPTLITNLVQNFISAKEEAEKENSSDNYQHFTEIHGVSILADVFFAGIDTTERTLEWLLLLLAHHQDIQEKAYRQVKEVVGEAVPGRSHRHRLVYLEACTMEALRLFPPAPMGLMHETSRDTKLMDYDIPGKTLVVTDIFTIQRNPEQWQDADHFKPERFLDKHGEKLNAKYRSWIPFSVGPRACAGETLARQQLIFAAAGVLQKMKITLPVGEEANFELCGSWFLLLPKPFKIHLTPRQ